MSMIVDVADAVAAELNAAPAGTFIPALTAQRRVLPMFELADLAGLKVTVVPKSMQITGSTRAASQIDLRVDIGVQRKLAAGDKDLDTEVALLGELIDSIARYLRRRPLTAAPWASWVSMTNDPVYAPDHLTQHRVFTSVLTLTYRVMR